MKTNGMKSNILWGEVQCKECNVCIVLLPFLRDKRNVPHTSKKTDMKTTLKS